MDLKKIRELSDTELNLHLVKAGEQLFLARFQKSMGNLHGLQRSKQHKLEIAQVKTVQRQREASFLSPKSSGSAKVSKLSRKKKAQV